MEHNLLPYATPGGTPMHPTPLPVLPFVLDAM